MLLDPYAPLVKGRTRYGVRDEWEQFTPKVRCRSMGCLNVCASVHVCVRVLEIGVVDSGGGGKHWPLQACR